MVVCGQQILECADLPAILEALCPLVDPRAVKPRPRSPWSLLVVGHTEAEEKGR